MQKELGNICALQININSYQYFWKVSYWSSLNNINININILPNYQYTTTIIPNSWHCTSQKAPHGDISETKGGIKRPKKFCNKKICKIPKYAKDPRCLNRCLNKILGTGFLWIGFNNLLSFFLWHLQKFVCKKVYNLICHGSNSL